MKDEKNLTRHITTNSSIFILFVILLSACNTVRTKKFDSYPASGKTNINPDTHLKITFADSVLIGKKGKIRIYEYDTDKLIDSLDLSIPAGPTETISTPEATYTKIPYDYSKTGLTNANTKPGTPSGTAQPTTNKYQLTIIGGFSDGFHFYPVIIKDHTATIYLHNNLLEYNKRYYVLIDSTVLHTQNNHFKGIYNKKDWNFTTKKTPPDLSGKQLIVDNNGDGDFNTLQGALDYIPDFSIDTTTILIKPGIYNELIYFRNKSNVVIKGTNKDSVIIQYANNEVFNPHPVNLKTNEWPGTFPSRRAAFSIDNCSNIQLTNLTIKSLLKGQAEGLLINGEKIFVKDVHIVGDGDALQTNGPAYFENVKIHGGGDMILGRGPAFFKNSIFYSPGPFMWIRNTKANHGNVFLNCLFNGTNDDGSELARAPINNGVYSYPYAESVLLNCKLDNIVPYGWGPVGDKTDKLHYWEYNSTYIDDNLPVDTKNRKKYSRQLTLPKDKQLIKNYSDPCFVLSGWQPLAFYR